MNKYILLIFIIPIVAQDLMINSFDEQSDFDNNYWQLDLTGDSNIGYANYAPASTSHDGTGAIEIEYSAHNSENWGGFTKLSHFHPDPDSVYDLTGFNTISFWFYNDFPASQSDRMDLRFVLFDISTSLDNNVYSESQVEYFYSFHFDMLDVDGMFGQDTTRAVVQFQTIHHLTTDGVAGPLTRNALEKVIKYL